MTQRHLTAALVALAIAMAGVAAWWWWSGSVPASPAPVSTSPATPPASVSTKPAPPPAGASQTVERAATEPRAPAAPLESAGIGPAFDDLFGAAAAKTWLRLDDFPRRFVATVDSLGGSHSPALLWPVDPTAGRFTVIETAGRTLIAPDNALRYAPFVHFAEGIDSAAAVALYSRLLPLLQSAYEALGYPGRRFHTRLLNVIDHLLAAPDAPETIEVRLTEVRGPIPSQRPWVRYEFADPALESASAGHKFMLRVGAENQRRLKTKLNALRAELLRQAAE